MAGTREMITRCPLYLHLISLVGRWDRAKLGYDWEMREADR